VFIAVFKRKIDTPQKTPQKITKLESAILKLLHKNQKYTRKDIALKMALSEETVKEYIHKLKAKGVLTREGGRKLGQWEIIEK
jgi:ATP-dependent DNA helicase RecG